jgi:kynurenine formamidase
MSELVDVSHAIENGTITYPGLPAPIVCDFLSREASKAQYAEGTSFHIGRIDMVANTGTYVDAPFHRFEDGKDLAELPLTAIADLPGLVVTSDDMAIGPEAFQDIDVHGHAVLVKTGWDRYWGTPEYLSGHPFLTEAAAHTLLEAGAALVGIDSLNIDDTRGGSRPVHTLLLGAEIPIVEHLCNLGDLPDEGFRFHAAPVKVRAFGTFPVRAYAVVG